MPKLSGNRIGGLGIFFLCSLFLNIPETIIIIHNHAQLKLILSDQPRLFLAHNEILYLSSTNLHLMASTFYINVHLNTAFSYIKKYQFLRRLHIFMNSVINIFEEEMRRAAKIIYAL